MSAGLVLAHDALSGIPWLTFYLLLTPFPLTASTLYRDAPTALVLFAVWASYFRDGDRTMLLGAAWMAVAYVPLLPAPLTEHALYLPSVGWGLSLAGGANLLAKRGAEHWKARRADPNLANPISSASLSGEA